MSILHVFKDEKDKQNHVLESSAFHRYMSNVKHKHIEMVDQNAYEGIVQFVSEDEPDMLVAIPRDRGFFEQIFHQSVTEKLVYHTQIPILILN